MRSLECGRPHRILSSNLSGTWEDEAKAKLLTPHWPLRIWFFLLQMAGEQPVMFYTEVYPCGVLGIAQTLRCCS